MTLEEQINHIMKNFESSSSKEILEILNKIMPEFKSELTSEYLQGKIHKKTQLENQSPVDGLPLSFLVQRNRRFLHKCARWSKLQFHLLSDDSLKALKDELIYQRVARDKDGKGLVWTGEIPPAGAPTTPVPAQCPTSDAAVTTPSVEQTPSRFLQPTAVPSTMKGTEPDEPIRPSPEAERRQLTNLCQ